MTAPVADLIHRHHSGDAEAAPALAAAYLPVARSLALAGTLDPDAARGVAERALARFVEGLGEHSEPGDLLAGMEGAVREEVRTAVRESGGRPSHLVGLPAEAAARATGPTPDLEEVLGDQRPADTAWMILEVMEQVPDRYEALLLLRYMEGLSYEDIGELSGLSREETARELNAGRRLFERELGFQLERLAKS